jgi:hypothetical protein
MNLRLVLLHALVLPSVAGCAPVNAHPSNWNQCNALPPPPVTFAQTVGAGTAPTPLGGTIVARTYDLTSETIYGASSLIENAPPETYIFDAASFQGLTRDYAAAVGTCERLQDLASRLWQAAGHPPQGVPLLPPETCA